MNKVKSLAELKLMKTAVEADLLLRENSTNPELHIQIKIAMDSCGIAAGAKAVMEAIMEELNAQKINAIVTQMECYGNCKAEPVVEITLPGKSPVAFGAIDVSKVKLLIDQYIIKGVLIEGVLPTNDHTI